MSTRVMIVEDEGLYRDLLKSSLSQQPTLEIVGCAKDGASAIRMAREHKPDVAIMDIELGPEPNGIQAGRHIKKDNPRTGVVILSSHKDKEYLNAVPMDEASGWSYLTKQSLSDLPTLMRAIEGTAAGLSVVDPAIVRALRPRPSTLLQGLTPRQLEVLSLIAQGYSNAGIAQKLFLGEKSVENYINTLYQQLQILREQPIHPRVKATLVYMRESQLS